MILLHACTITGNCGENYSFNKGTGTALKNKHAVVPFIRNTLPLQMPWLRYSEG